MTHLTHLTPFERDATIFCAVVLLLAAYCVFRVVSAIRKIENRDEDLK